jgi:hypothetical protein
LAKAAEAVVVALAPVLRALVLLGLAVAREDQARRLVREATP